MKYGILILSILLSTLAFLNASAVSLKVRSDKVFAIKGTEKNLVKKIIDLQPDHTVLCDTSGYAILTYPDNTYIKLRPDTELTLLLSGVRLKRGNAYFIITKKGSKFIVETKNAIAGIRGTEFEVEIQKNIANFFVYKGSIDVKTRSGRRIPLRKNYKLSIGPLIKKIKPVKFNIKERALRWKSKIWKKSINPKKLKRKKAYISDKLKALLGRLDFYKNKKRSEKKESHKKIRTLFLKSKSEKKLILKSKMTAESTRILTPFNKSMLKILNKFGTKRHPHFSSLPSNKKFISKFKKPVKPKLIFPYKHLGTSSKEIKKPAW